MMNKNNAYFEELKRIGHEWEAARIERKVREIGGVLLVSARRIG